MYAFDGDFLGFHKYLPQQLSHGAVAASGVRHFGLVDVMRPDRHRRVQAARLEAQCLRPLVSASCKVVVRLLTGRLD